LTIQELYNTLGITNSQVETLTNQVNDNDKHNQRLINNFQRIQQENNTLRELIEALSTKYKQAKEKIATLTRLNAKYTRLNREFKYSASSQFKQLQDEWQNQLEDVKHRSQTEKDIFSVRISSLENQIISVEEERVKISKFVSPS
jgi:predicted nuclease with TOPRIM domain